MSFGSFIGWTLGTAVFIPLAPLGLVYACLHNVTQSGNGADAWGTFAILMASIFGTAVAGVICLIAVANPVIAAIIYGILCLAVGISAGVSQ